MRRCRLLVLMGFTACLAGSVPAQADGLVQGTDVVATATEDPVGALTSTASESVGTASGAVGSATSAASGAASSTFGGANVVSQTPQGTASSSAGPGSGGSGGRTSNRGSAAGSHADRKAPGRAYHTRFDRLPRRPEILIERIELGRDVRANLLRLEALLARSPALRAELARALRSELARLRKGGLRGAELAQARRLVRVQRALAPSASGSSSTLGSLSLTPETVIESATSSAEDATLHSDVADTHVRPEASNPGKGILGSPPLQDSVDRAPGWLMILLGIVLGSSLVGLAAIVLIAVSQFPRAFP